ncbi:MAG TPA: exodeoxyribonuclease VII small subunit [Chitinophagaceae bacterium]
MMEENLTYEAAYRELEQIYNQINNEQVSIDELAVKVKRAATLISFCQAKLRDTEVEINKIISEMPNRDTGSSGSAVGFGDESEPL